MTNPYEAPSSQTLPADGFEGIEFPVRESAQLSPNLLADAHVLRSGKLVFAVKTTAATMGTVAFLFCLAAIHYSWTREIALQLPILLFLLLVALSGTLLWAWALFGSRLSHWLLRRQFDRNPHSRSIVHYEFDRQGFTIRETDGELEMAWSQVRRWKTNDQIAIGIYTRRAFAIFAIGEFSPQGRLVIRQASDNR